MKRQICAALMLTLWLGSAAYALQAQSVSGKVVKVDNEGGVIDVQTVNGTEQFFVVTESNLYMEAHHMSSVEINANDAVDIQYAVTDDGKKNIIRLIDHQKATF